MRQVCQPRCSNARFPCSRLATRASLTAVLIGSSAPEHISGAGGFRRGLDCVITVLEQQ